MKNLAKIFMAVVLLAGITSCVQDTTVDGGIFQPTTEVTISVEDANRTALGAKTDEGTYPVYWSNGDKVSINGIASKALVVEGENQVAKGLFEFTGDLVTPYKASYPATAAAGQVLFAAKQSYKEGTFSEGAAAMYGESETLAIQMQHAAGVLQFPIKAAEGAEVVLSHAVVTNLNGSLAGTYNASLVEGELVLTAAEGATSNITYDCGGLELSTEPVKLHIAVPAGEYEELKVSLVATNGQVMNFKVTAVGEKKVKAGIVREFNKVNGITFSGNESSFAITDSESLMEFAKLCAEGGFAYGKAKVMNDFTFDSAAYTWVPVEGFNFGAEFDGNDCTITGLPDALFGTAKADIHNLTLNSTIERAAVEANGIGLFACLFEGSVVDCTAKGSLTVTGSGTSGYSGHGGVIGECVGSISFVNVVNEATVTVDGVNNTRNGVAGILGGTQGDGSPVEGVTLSFTNCHNKADLTSTVNGDKKRRNMGGLLGYSEGEHTITITSCSNSGDILNNTVIDDMHLGGLIGTNMCPMTTITDSYNTGNVTCAGDQVATGNNYSMGGLVGYQTGAVTITKCANGATIAGGVMTKIDTPNVITIGNAPGGVALGGVVGYFSSTWADYTYSVSECKNYGSVITTKDCGKSNNGYEARAGGIVGYINVAGAMTISQCHNYGLIERDATEVTADAEGNLWNSKGDCGGIVCRVANGGGAILIEECVNEADAVISYKGAKRGEVNHGGIMGCSGGHDIIRNCQNYGTITSSGTMNTAMSLGGILGNVSHGSTVVDGCTNHGTVEQTAGAADRLFVGGIVGYSYSPGTVQNCINDTDAVINIVAVTAANTYSATNYIAVGGVVGYARGDGASETYPGKIYNCTNNAPITFKGYSANAYHAGGVVGILEMPAEKLYNTAALTFSGIATTRYNFAGVAGKVHGKNMKTLHNSGELTFSGQCKTGDNASNNVIAADASTVGGVVGLLGTNATALTADDLKNTASINICPPAGDLVNGKGWANGGVFGIVNGFHVTNAQFGEETQTKKPQMNFENTTANARFKGGNSNALLAIGGVGASAQQSAVIDNCVNWGHLNINSAATNNQHNNTFGGIVCWVPTNGNVTITDCINRGNITFGSAHRAGNKSMNGGGISGSFGNGTITKCKNYGTITFKQLNNNNSASNSSGDYCWYSAIMGGIAGSINIATVTECENHGAFVAEELSLNRRASGVYTTFGGIAGIGADAKLHTIENCKDYGTYTVNANSAVADVCFWCGGILARVFKKATGPYIVKDCTAEPTIYAPANTQVGIVTGSTWAQASVNYTPVAETDYPIIGCKVDGAITRSGKDLADVTIDNFFEVTYADTPSVDSWVPVVGDDGVIRYHGNYGVETAGGDSTDDLG